jgi:acyl carrier protein
MARVFSLGSTEAALSLVKADGGSWDSLRHVELLFAVEDAFNIRFSEEDFAKIASFHDLELRIQELQEGN